MKVYTRIDPLACEAAARREFAALQHLWNHRMNFGFLTPEPLALVTEPPAIVMGFVPGRELDDGLTRRLRHLPPLGLGRLYLRRFRRLGGCMREFARVPPAAEGGPIGEIVSHCRELLSRKEVAQVLTRSGLDRAADAIERSVVSLDPSLHAQYSRHGDLGPWNVRRSGSRLGLLDMEDYAPGFLLHDLADLFARFDRFVPLSGVPERRIRQLKTNVCRGFGAVPATEARLWPLLRICSAIELASWEHSYDEGVRDKRAVAEALLHAACAATAELSNLPETKA